MTVHSLKVNKNMHGTAPLQNIAILEGLLLKSKDRPDHLPGIVTFSGPSGFGKSTAAAWAAAEHDAAYLEFRSVWTKKAFLESFCHQLGLPKNGTMAQMTDMISEELALSQRPVIYDEFDYCVAKDGLVELVRDIYEQSKSPVILIGEENLPHKLQKWERFDGRILARSQAKPANLSDARALNKHYEPGIIVADDLLEDILHLARGSIRRIVTNLHDVRLFAQGEGLKQIGKKEWGDRPLQKSTAPATRSF